MRLTPFLLAALATGCAKAPGSVQGLAEIRQAAPPPREVRYVRQNVAGPMELPTVPIAEQWVGPLLDDDLICYDVTTMNSASSAVLESVRVFYAPEGMGYVGTVNADGQLDRWSPRQLVFPAQATAGQSWEATHTKGGVSSTRRCEIQTSDGCEGGLVSVCESTRDDGTVVLRDHFCPGFGWSGFEALVVRPNQPPVRMWSESVVKDGVPGPSLQAP